MVILLISSNVVAKTYDMLFWYPGGAGSTLDAQPVMELFSEYMSAKVAPDKLNATYVTSEEKGWKFIKKHKPVIAIISFPMWIKSENKLKDAKTMLSCIPLPAGKPIEKYMLVRTSEEPSEILSSFPMSAKFSEMTFPNLSKTAKYRATTTILATVKRIAEGHAFWAVLTPDEAYSIMRMKSDWVKKLKTKESKPVPTAQVINLTNNPIIKKIQDIFKAIDKDTSAKEILEELRLKGFKSN